MGILDDFFAGVSGAQAKEDHEQLGSIFQTLKDNIWIVKGVRMFGENVAVYRKTLIDGGVSESDATKLTAKTIEEIVRALASVASAATVAVGPVLQAADDAEHRQQKHGGKEMP